MGARPEVERHTRTRTRTCPRTGGCTLPRSRTGSRSRTREGPALQDAFTNTNNPTLKQVFAGAVRERNDRLTKFTILVFVLPVSYIAFSILAHWPLALLAGLLPVGREAALFSAAIIGHAIGFGTAIWTCRLAWPRPRTTIG